MASCVRAGSDLTLKKKKKNLITSTPMKTPGKRSLIYLDFEWEKRNNIDLVWRRENLSSPLFSEGLISPGHMTNHRPFPKGCDPVKELWFKREEEQREERCELNENESRLLMELAVDLTKLTSGFMHFLSRHITPAAAVHLHCRHPPLSLFLRLLLPFIFWLPLASAPPAQHR